jgi:putative transcriptional regulator
MESLQGSLLVAAPELSDPNFARTVVLIVQHSPQGALGLVLNRPSQVTVQQVLAKLTGGESGLAEPVFLGGPCEGPLLAVHTRAECSEIEILDGLHFCGSPEKIERLLAANTRPVRVFGGYAGWGPGQLEGELEEHAWLVSPAQPRYVFGQSDQIWEQLNSELSLLARLNIRQLPRDPRLN